MLILFYKYFFTITYVDSFPWIFNRLSHKVIELIVFAEGGFSFRDVHIRCDIIFDQ